LNGSKILWVSKRASTLELTILFWLIRFSRTWTSFSSLRVEMFFSRTRRCGLFVTRINLRRFGLFLGFAKLVVPFSRGKQVFFGIIVTALFREVLVFDFIMINFRYRISSLVIIWILVSA
jgi:hypothetical protein